MGDAWRMKCPRCGAKILLRPQPRPEVALQCASCGSLLDPAGAQWVDVSTVPAIPEVPVPTPAAKSDDEDWDVVIEGDAGPGELALEDDAAKSAARPKPVAAPALPRTGAKNAPARTPPAAMAKPAAPPPAANGTSGLLDRLRAKFRRRPS